MLPELITSLVTTLTDHLGEIIDTGIELIMSLIDGIMEALPLLIEQMPIIISKLVSAIITNLPKIIEMGIKLITSLISGLVKATPQLIRMFPQLIKDIGSELVKNFPQIVENGKSMLKSLLDGAKSMFGNLVKMGGEIISNIVSSLASLPSKMIDVGKNLIQGIWNGISNMKTWLVNKVKSIGSTITGAVKSALGIHSPSTIMRDVVGKNLALGIGEGFTDEMKSVSSEMADAIPTSFDSNLTASGLPSSSLSATGGYATSALVEAFKTAMQGMRIEMGEDGFASFVVDTITSEIYQ
jgi:phage-related protein